MANDDIYHYVVPRDPNSADPHGVNTNWASKVIVKAPDGNVYVASVPTADGFKPTPKYGDFLNLSDVLSAISPNCGAQCSITLIPVTFANRLVSLSDVPGSRILETFAREIVQRSSGRAECLL